MGSPAQVRDARYTYADYLTWSDDERWELIDGVAYNMTPAPSRKHQKISWELSQQIGAHLRGKKCQAYTAPFDVRLPAPGEVDDTTGTVVQPDMVVVCDPAKLDDRGCKGAPDLVIEIVSPESVARDMKEKFLLYERAGVAEYWIVHPIDRVVSIFHRGPDGFYGKPDVHTAEERVPVGVLQGLEIDLSAVFSE